jgi:hypothetical protein
MNFTSPYPAGPNTRVVIKLERKLAPIAAIIAMYSIPDCAARELDADLMR